MITFNDLLVFRGVAVTCSRYKMYVTFAFSFIEIFYSAIWIRIYYSWESSQTNVSSQVYNLYLFIHTRCEMLRNVFVKDE